MRNPPNPRQSRVLLFVCAAILLLYAASHAYHFWHIRLRFPPGTSLRIVMELGQAPMVLSRMFAPFLGVIAAIWFLAEDSRKILGVILVVAMTGGCFVSLPYVYIGFVIPLCISTALFGSIFWLSRYPFRRTRKRKKLGLCLECGYDLRGSKDTCPECGTEF